MNTDIISEILNFAFTHVNIAVIIILLGIGYMIKHLSTFTKISNNLIPCILIVCGIILMFVQSATISRLNLLEIVTSGFINAAISIGIHQSGKTLIDIVSVKLFKKE